MTDSKNKTAAPTTATTRTRSAATKKDVDDLIARFTQKEGEPVLSEHELFVKDATEAFAERVRDLVLEFGDLLNSSSDVEASAGVLRSLTTAVQRSGHAFAGLPSRPSNGQDASTL